MNRKKLHIPKLAVVRMRGQGTRKLVSSPPALDQTQNGTVDSDLEALFATVSAGIAFLDDTFCYRRVNPAYAAALGHEQGFFPGKNHFTLFPDPQLEAVFHRVLETRQPVSLSGQPVAYLQSGGKTRYWNFFLQPLSGPDQAVTSLSLTVTDVTARVLTERTLRNTRTMYDHLFASSLDANILVDEEGRIESVNPAAEKIFGYSREALGGQRLEVLIPDLQNLSLFRSGGYGSGEAPSRTGLDSLRLELPARRQDGSRFLGEINLSPVETGDSSFLLCMVRDISPRVKREQDLRAQSELVRLLQDVAIAANAADTIDAAFQYAVDRLAGYLRCPLGQAQLVDEGDEPFLVSRGWNSQIPEAYQPFVEASMKLQVRLGDGLSGIAVEKGQPVWMENLSENPYFLRREAATAAGLKTGLAVPVISGKTAVGVLEFFYPRTVPPDSALMEVLPHIGMQLGRVVERTRAAEALRKSAAQLQTVISNLPMFLWVIDRDGRLLMLEGKGVAALGIEPDSMLGKVVFDQLNIRPESLELIRRTLAGEEIHTELVAGTGAVFESFFTPYYNPGGEVDGMIGLSFDISARKSMEVELDEMKHRLLDSIDSERARLAQQLHDGPLQDLYGAFYQIQEVKNSLPETSQEPANKALQIIQTVNATLRVIVGELHPNTLVHLGLQQAIRSHVGRLQERLEGIVIHLDMADDAQSLPYQMRLGLYRVYQQLIENAVHHSRARHIWVRLRLLPEMVTLEVQDNGQGFSLPANWISLVREGKFGLVSARERLEGMKGSLEISARPGRGTLARASVPR